MLISANKASAFSLSIPWQRRYVYVSWSGGLYFDGSSFLAPLFLVVCPPILGGWDPGSWDPGIPGSGSRTPAGATLARMIRTPAGLSVQRAGRSSDKTVEVGVPQIWWLFGILVQKLLVVDWKQGEKDFRRWRRQKWKCCNVAFCRSVTSIWSNSSVSSFVCRRKVMDEEVREKTVELTKEPKRIS